MVKRVWAEVAEGVIASLVDEIVTVTDAEIIDAMPLLYEGAKLVMEPSGASAFAAVLADLERLRVLGHADQHRVPGPVGAVRGQLKGGVEVPNARARDAAQCLAIVKLSVFGDEAPAVSSAMNTAR